MPETITYIDAAGVATVLTDQPDLEVLWGVQGRFMPPVSFIEDEIPLQPGTVLQDVTVGPREVALPLEVSAKSEIALRARIRSLLRSFQPTRGDARLRVTAPDGTQREIVCRYAGGLEGDESEDRSGLYWQRVIVVFKAFAPYWQDTADTAQTNLALPAASNFFPFFPLVLATSGILTSFPVINAGDVETWPVWTIIGPGTNPILRNRTTGKRLELALALAAGQRILIDTRPRKKLVTRENGTNVFSSLSPISELWELTEGVNTVGLEMGETRTHEGAAAAATFARGSIARRRDTLAEVTSGVARFEAGQSGQAVLIEEATTNLLLRAEEFDNAYWTKGNVTVAANAIAAPDGTMTADKIVESADASAVVHQVYKSTAVMTVGGPGTISVYAKAGERSWLQILIDGAQATYFDLANGVLGSVAAGITATITPVGNGWYRCSAAKASLTSGTVHFRIAPGDGTASYTGDGASGLYLWGAQAEDKAYRTSYMRTVDAAATRSTETVTLPPEVVSRAEGTVDLWAYVNAETGYLTGRYLWMFDDGSGDNFIGIRRQGSGFGVARAYGAIIDPAGLPAQSINPTISFPVGWHHFALTWKASEAVFYVDGLERGRLTNPVLPTAGPTRHALGTFAGASNHYNDVIDSLRVSSTAHSAAAVLADYNRGGALPVEADTTYRMNADGDFTAQRYQEPSGILLSYRQRYLGA